MHLSSTGSFGGRLGQKFLLQVCWFLDASMCIGLLPVTSLTFLKKLFHHDPLQSATEIRLINLFPGTREESIHCEIFHTNLDAQPDYEAVSYTWGSPVISSSISCGKYGILSVTENCEAALRDLRYRYHKRILWIDAICINQAKNGEKTHQVRLMRRIYERAKCVMIYLGPVVPDDIANSVAHLEKSKFSTAHNVLQRLLDQEPTTITENMRLAVKSLISMPWFSGVWVLQEVAVARAAVVMLGPYTIDWNLLALGRLASLGMSVDKNGSTPAVLRIAPKYSQPFPDLISLIHTARSCFSSDPRDKIYALQGLLKDSCCLDMSPDYDMRVEDVYTETTRRVIHAHNHLDILSEVGKEEPSQGSNDAYQAITYARQHTEEAMLEACDATNTLGKAFRNLVLGFPEPKPYLFSQKHIRDRISSSLEDTTQLGKEYSQIDMQEIYKPRIKLAAVISSWFQRSMGCTEQFHEAYFEAGELAMQAEQKGREAERLYGMFQTKISLPEEFVSFSEWLLPDKHLGQYSALNLPSWVPDFSTISRLSSLDAWRSSSANPEPYSAEFISPDASLSAKVLKVRARIIDAFVTSKLPRTVWFVDYMCGSIRIDTYDNFMNDAHIFLPNVLSSDDRALRHRYNSFSNFCRGRKLGVTGKSFAICPIRTRASDFICVLDGASVPFILRQKHPDRRVFELVGECYLYGLSSPRVPGLTWGESDTYSPLSDSVKKIPWETILIE